MSSHPDLHFGHVAGSDYVGGPESFSSPYSGSNASGFSGRPYEAPFPFVDCRLSNSASYGPSSSPGGGDDQQSASTYPSHISVQQTAQSFDRNETAYEQQRDHQGNVYGQPPKEIGLQRSNAQRGPYNLRPTAQGPYAHATSANPNAAHRSASSWNLDGNRAGEWGGSETFSVPQNEYNSSAPRLRHPKAEPSLVQDGAGNVTDLLTMWEAWVENQQILGGMGSGKSTQSSTDDDVKDPVGQASTASTADPDSGSFRPPSPVDTFAQLVEAASPPTTSPSKVLGGWHYPPPANGPGDSAGGRASITPPPVPPKIPLEHPNAPMKLRDMDILPTIERKAVID